MFTDTRYIDNHTHTLYSDGGLTPTELVIHAKEKAIELDKLKGGNGNNLDIQIAITDHDTVDGNDEAIEAGKEHGVKVISGVEFSSYFEYPDGRKTSVHIVGLDINDKNKLLKETLNMLNLARLKSLSTIVEVLNNIKTPSGESVNISTREVIGSTSCKLINKKHIADFMVKKGYVINIDQAFELYLGDEVFNKYVTNEQRKILEDKYISPREAIELIKGSGGKSYIAHGEFINPGTQNKQEIVQKFISNINQFKEILRYYKYLGVNGAEVFCNIKNKLTAKLIYDITQELDFDISGGSDFHDIGSKKPDLFVGFDYLGLNRVLQEKMKQSKHWIKV